MDILFICSVLSCWTGRLFAEWLLYILAAVSRKGRCGMVHSGHDIAPPPSPFAETHKIEVGPPVFGQRQGWDGSPGWSTTASQGLLLETFRETLSMPSRVSSPGGKNADGEKLWSCLTGFRAPSKAESLWPGLASLWNCTFQTGLGRESSFLWKLRSKLCSGTGLRQVSLGNPRSLDHSCLYIWGNRLLLLESSRERRDGGHTERQLCGLCVPRRHRAAVSGWCWLWNLLWMLSRASLIAQLEGKGYPLQYPGLENSMNCMVHGVTKSQTRLSDFHFYFGCEVESLLLESWLDFSVLSSWWYCYLSQSFK